MALQRTKNGKDAQIAPTLTAYLTRLVSDSSRVDVMSTTKLATRRRNHLFIDLDKAFHETLASKRPLSFNIDARIEDEAAKRIQLAK
jgi:hypothetical protein